MACGLRAQSKGRSFPIRRYCSSVAIVVLIVSLARDAARAAVPAVDSALVWKQQTVTPPLADSSAPAQSQDAPASAPKLVLKNGTPVELKFTRTVSSSQVIAGEKIDLRVTSEVRMGDVVVIGKDALAEAVVSVAQAKRTMARGGYLELKIETVHLASGEAAPLRMTEDVKGGGHKVPMIAGMIAVGVVDSGFAPLFLSVQGKDAMIPNGAKVTAYVNGDVPLDLTKFLTVSNAKQSGREDVVPQSGSSPK
jgi:hypothetical protein